MKLMITHTQYKQKEIEKCRKEFVDKNCTTNFTRHQHESIFFLPNTYKYNIFGETR